jgi:hypothetical protein
MQNVQEKAFEKEEFIPALLICLTNPAAVRICKRKDSDGP